MSKETPKNTNQDILQTARSVLIEEAEALNIVSQSLNNQFIAACQLILDCKGKVVVMGMGKSGHIARKISATLASTGTPSFYIHPSEALHGDLGMIEEHDILLALSFSGQNDETISLTPYLQQHDVTWISMTGNPDSAIAKSSNCHLHIPVEHEACPLGLAPTTSTTAMLALGDALAICLLHARGFTKHDFAKTHPSGRLGKQLLLRATDIAHYGKNLPVINEKATIADAIVEMSAKRLGLTLIESKNNNIIGIFTDGDLRRSIEAKRDLHTTKIIDVMHNNPIKIPAECPLSEALAIMNSKRITSLIVSKNDNTWGILHMHDILATGAF